MTQILSGHAFNKSYLKRFKIIDEEKCPCDDVTPQTIDHIMKQCPRYALQRHYLTTACAAKNKTPFELTSQDRELLKIFEEFLKDIIGSLKEFNK